MNATAEQIEKAKQMADNSNVLSFERCLEIVLKGSVKQMSKKDIRKMDSRNRIESGKVKANFDFAERMRENARKNLPSSMR